MIRACKFLTLVAATSMGCVVDVGVYDGPCDKLLRCVAAADAGKLSDQIAVYGPEGSCWKSVPRYLCEQNCAGFLTAYADSMSGIRECSSGKTMADAFSAEDHGRYLDGGTPPGDADATDMSTRPVCGPATCIGCCQGGICQPGTAASACGTAGANCTMCGASMACDAAARTCGPDPFEQIKLTIYSADIYSSKANGDCWDFPCGPPDPYVTVDGVRETTIEDDTRYPIWNTTRSFPRYQVMGSGISIAVWDRDVSYDDNVARGRTLRVTETDLMKGKIEWGSWDDVRSMTFYVSR